MERATSATSYDAVIQMTFDTSTRCEEDEMSDTTTNECPNCHGLGRYAIADVENGPEFDVIVDCECAGQGEKFVSNGGDEMGVVYDPSDAREG